MNIVTAYFSSSIRGPLGNTATQIQIDANLEQGKEMGAEIRSLCGSNLKLYVPHDQDDCIQVLWHGGVCTARQIIDADIVILSEKDLCIFYWPYTEDMVGGCLDEFVAAKERGIPIIKYSEYTDKVKLNILETVFKILKDKNA